MGNNKDIHARMRVIHDVLVMHDCHAGPESGCTCGVLYAEMKALWLKLNEHKRAFQPRAGPFPGVSMPPTRSEVGDMLNELKSDNHAFLKQSHDE